MPRKPKPVKSSPPTLEEKRTAAKAWARFLYDEYMLEKHKQLLSKPTDKKMEGT
jgi:hypothetical protein